MRGAEIRGAALASVFLSALSSSNWDANDQRKVPKGFPDSPGWPRGKQASYNRITNWDGGVGVGSIASAPVLCRDLSFGPNNNRMFLIATAKAVPVGEPPWHIIKAQHIFVGSSPLSSFHYFNAPLLFVPSGLLKQ